MSLSSAASSPNPKQIPERSLLIAVPTYKPLIDYRVLECIDIATSELPGWTINKAIQPNFQDIGGVRNVIAASFLAGPWSHLLFWDADITCAPKTIPQLVSHEVDLIIGAYQKRDGSKQFPISLLPGKPEQKSKGLIAIRSGPAGMMLISRNCLERLVATYIHRSYIEPAAPGGKAWSLFEFEIDPHDNRRISEDISFCNRWRATGGTVWCDSRLQLWHHGETAYGGVLYDYLKEQDLV